VNNWKSGKAIDELKYTKDPYSPSVAIVLSLFLMTFPLRSFLLAFLIHLSDPVFDRQFPLLSFRRNILDEASGI